MKKHCPFHRHDILAITQWLNEYSSYGWALKSWGSFLVEFVEYNGPRYQYQIDMDNWEDEANAERRRELEALGWEYVGTIHSTRCHIYRSTDCKASLPIDQEFIAYNRKKLRFAPLYGIGGALLTLGAFLIVPVSKMQFLLVQLNQKDKSAVPLALVVIVITILHFFNSEWYDYQLYKYLGRVRENAKLVPEQEWVEPRIHLPLELIQWGLIIGALIFVLWLEYGNKKEYVEPIFAERYYDKIELIHEPFEEYNLLGYYWMNVSEDVADELFDQIVERYAGYSSYYGNGLFGKEKYDTHDLWNLIEREDERFEKLVIAQEREYDGDGLVFAQIGNDIIYLRYWGEWDVSLIIDEITKIDLQENQRETF